jgi:FkbM family methyltransferase
MKFVKRSIRNFFRFFGLEISRFKPRSHAVLHLQIKTVFDIGANTGQYAQDIRELGYTKKIVSFEPLSEAYSKLILNSASDRNWHIHDRCAIGESEDNLEINISGNSFSSSLMPMLDAHSNAEPSSKYVGKEIVSVIPLNKTFKKYASVGQTNFLKIDTQGFEYNVLKGIEEYFDFICGIELELSTVPLYEGSKLYSFYFDYFKKNGFELWTLEPEFMDPKSGKMLQFNATFINTNIS